ncbi:hypothetical protein L227DRAFT_65813 [Lentinus tigrinus ALCF2SS1-6]|uniref:Uncharacterized protein n=1 Tax=Lentinus tigrinus ALCF2SS1-6 TaxID=1328759 RepID=A0A5C2SIU1_9APHY|nr:hypothetical protein L227DRAFT_65813 [Lentinus tigrinus ALCF2SS1-6]
MLGPIRPLTNLILLRSFSGAVPRVMSTIVAVAMSLENPQPALRSRGCGHVVDMRSKQASPSRPQISDSERAKSIWRRPPNILKEFWRIPSTRRFRTY